MTGSLQEKIEEEPLIMVLKIGLIDRSDWLNQRPMSNPVQFF
jgi:hypothetical protein